MKTNEFRDAISQLDDRYIVQSIDALEKRRVNRKARLKNALLIAAVAAAVSTASLCLFFSLHTGNDPENTKLENPESFTVTDKTKQEESGYYAVITIGAEENVQIRITEEQKVLSVNAENGALEKTLNADGYVGKTVEEVVAELSPTLMEHNYFSTAEKSVRLSVSSIDQNADFFCAELEERAAAIIEESCPGISVQSDVRLRTIIFECGSLLDGMGEHAVDFTEFVANREEVPYTFSYCFSVDCLNTDLKATASFQIWYLAEAEDRFGKTILVRKYLTKDTDTGKDLVLQGVSDKDEKGVTCRTLYENGINTYYCEFSLFAVDSSGKVVNEYHRQGEFLADESGRFNAAAKEQD